MSYHARIMNIPAYPDAPLEYKEGHRDARHAAASVALEAETDIVWLRAEVKRLREALYECLEYLEPSFFEEEALVLGVVKRARAALAGEG